MVEHIQITAAAVAEAVQMERDRCAKILRKHVKIESAGKCCDNCNCLALKNALDEISR